MAATRPAPGPVAVGGRLRAAGRLLWCRVRSMPAPLVVLLVLAAAVGTAWSIAVAPLQGPDETAHAEYVQHLAETGHVPSFDIIRNKPEVDDQRVAADQLDLLRLRGVTGARPPWSTVMRERWRHTEAHLPASLRTAGATDNPEGKTPPLYYAYEALPYLVAQAFGVLTRLAVLRLGSVVLFVVTVGLVWALAAELFTATWPRALAASLVVLHPGYAFESGVVNPDDGLAVLWAAFLVVGVRTLKRGPTAGRIIGLFALAAASALTQGRGLALVPPLAALLVLLLVAFRPPLGRYAAWSGGGLLLALGAYELYRRGFAASSGGAFGGEVNAGGSVTVGGFLSQAWQFYLPKLSFMANQIGPPYGYRQMFIETFYGTFGSLEIVYKGTVYDLLQIASTCGLVALVIGVVTRWPAVRARWTTATFLVVTALSLIGFLNYVSYRALAGNPADPLVVGRYLNAGIALWAIAIVVAIWTFPRRVRPVLAGATVAAGALLQLGGLALTLTRFYA